MTKDQIRDYRLACAQVVMYCPDPYAVSYASTGIELHSEDYILAQIGYILSNMSHWRGPVAHCTRKTFKRIVGAKDE